MTARAGHWYLPRAPALNEVTFISPAVQAQVGLYCVSSGTLTGQCTAPTSLRINMSHGEWGKEPKGRKNLGRKATGKLRPRQKVWSNLRGQFIALLFPGLK